MPRGEGEDPKSARGDYCILVHAIDCKMWPGSGTRVYTYAVFRSEKQSGSLRGTIITKAELMKPGVCRTHALSNARFGYRFLRQRNARIIHFLHHLPGSNLLFVLRRI